MAQELTDPDLTKLIKIYNSRDSYRNSSEDELETTEFLDILRRRKPGLLERTVRRIESGEFDPEELEKSRQLATLDPNGFKTEVALPVKGLKNEVHVNTNGKKYVYIGVTNNLKFYDNFRNVCGSAFLYKLRVERLFFWSIRAEIWSYRSDYNNGSVFIKKGSTSDNYRKELMDEMAKNGVRFFPQFLNAVFAPIDKRLMEIYRQSEK